MVAKSKKQMTYTTSEIAAHYALRAAAQAEAARLAAEAAQAEDEDKAA